jgi:hypothetical protein
VATLPALAVPALAAATAVASIAPATAIPAVAPSKASPSVPSETRIDRLWKKRAAIIRKDAVLSKQIKKLERQRESALPEPDPSIVYSAENDMDGLTWWHTHLPPDRFIHPADIEKELGKLPDGTILTHATAVLLEKHGLKLPDNTPEQAARKMRLEKRLALSNARCDQIHELDLKLGLIQKWDEQEELTSQQGDVEMQIMTAKPLKKADIEKKFALYDRDSEEFHAPAILRDLRRLYEQEMTLPAEAVQS